MGISDWIARERESCCSGFRMVGLASTGKVPTEADEVPPSQPSLPTPAYPQGSTVQYIRITHPHICTGASWQVPLSLWAGIPSYILPAIGRATAPTPPTLQKRGVKDCLQAFLAVPTSSKKIHTPRKFHTKLSTATKPLDSFLIHRHQGAHTFPQHHLPTTQPPLFSACPSPLLPPPTTLATYKRASIITGCFLPSPEQLLTASSPGEL